MIKPLSIAIAAGSLALGATNSAQALDLGAGFSASANIGATSNYIWRGFSQTRNGAALQGGFDIAHESGFYIGTWLSHVDFKLAPEADYEQDFYLGWSKTFGEVEVGLNYNKFHYPSANSLNFSETSLSLAAFGFSLGLDFSSDFPLVGNATGTVDNSSTLHYSLGYSHELPQSYVIDIGVGRYDFKETGFLGGNDDKYSYYNIGVSKNFWGIDFNVSYTDSSLSRNACIVYTGGKNYCGDTFFITATKTFE